MSTDFDLLMAAIASANIPELRHLVAAGADINVRNEYGQPFLDQAIFFTAPVDELECPDQRCELIGAVLDLGADPNLLDKDGSSVLIGPIFSRDQAMLELLLERGVDPNHGCGDSFETVYDLADFDYWYESGFFTPTPTTAPIAEVRAETDAYLRFLDEAAQKAGRLRPELLFILRRHGALTGGEVARSLGGEGSESIVWRDGRWHLNPVDDQAPERA